MRFGNSKYWLFQVAGWGLFALINVFFAYSFEKMGEPEARRIFFTRLGIFVVLGILFTHLMRFVIIRLNTLQKLVEKQILHFSLVSVIFALITATFYMEACNRFGLLNEGEKNSLISLYCLFSAGHFISSSILLSGILFTSSIIM